MCVEWYPCSGNRKIVAVGLVCLLFVVALLQTVGGRRPVVGRWSLKRRLLVRWFVGSLVRWFVGSLVRWFVGSLVRCGDGTRGFVRLLAGSFDRPKKGPAAHCSVDACAHVSLSFLAFVSREDVVNARPPPISNCNFRW